MAFSQPSMDGRKSIKWMKKGLFVTDGTSVEFVETLT